MNWQPIDTAPRDGTRILVCGGTRSDSGDLYGGGSPFEGVAIAFWDSDGWNGGHAEGYGENWRHEPKHWMPLPPLPNIAICLNSEAYQRSKKRATGAPPTSAPSACSRSPA